MAKWGRWGCSWTGVALFCAASACGPTPAQAAELLFQAEAQTLAGACGGGPVRLEGNHNTVTLSGACASLVVKGLANTIQLTIAPHGLIHVEGSQNHVRFTAIGAAPAVEILGPDNSVTPGLVPRPTSAPPPPPSPPAAQPVAASAAAAKPLVPAPPLPNNPAKKAAGPLELAGDDQERLADCAGHDVVITGSRSAYIIRGVCHSLALRGDLLTVQAVVQPGAHISVVGRGSVVSWAIQGKGHAPASVVRGVGSRVQRAEAIGGEPVR